MKVMQYYGLFSKCSWNSKYQGSWVRSSLGAPLLQLRGLGNKDWFRLICLLHFVQIQSFCWTKLGGTAHADGASTTCRPHDTPTIQTPYKDINMRTIKRHNTLYCVKYLYIITVHLFNRYYIALSQSLDTRNTFAVNFTIKLNEQYSWQKYNKTTYREYASRGSLTLSHVLVCGCWCCCRGRCHYLYAYKLFEHFSDQLSNFQELKFRSK